MFEHHSESLASRRVFLRRLATSSGIGLIAILVFLFAGMLCFQYIEGLDGMDSFLNAAMLLGGMGPLEHQRGWWGKLFEGCYAVFCGLFIISVAGVILTPVVHRFLHKFHQHNHRE